MIHTSSQAVNVVNSAISDSDGMFDCEFTNTVVLTKSKTKESIELDQRRIQIRENQNGLMALSYIAPIFEMMDLEDFF